MKRSTLTLILTSLFMGANAANIRYVDYHPDNVTNITTAPGIASEIIFEEDEEIVYYTFGFDAAWDSTVARNHILIFKSKDEQPQTNLLVHTNKRHYIFTLTNGNDKWEKNPNSSQAIYSTRIRYKDNKSMQAMAKKEEEKELRYRTLNAGNKIYKNYCFRATKYANDIIPLRIWDNGTLTFILFPQGSKRGAIYERQADGKTALLNQHTEKSGVTVLHGVYENIIIRLGDEAVEIRRTLIGGRKDNLSKTNVPYITRHISGDAPDTFTQNADTPKEHLERAPIFKEQPKNSMGKEALFKALAE